MSLVPRPFTSTYKDGMMGTRGRTFHPETQQQASTIPTFVTDVICLRCAVTGHVFYTFEQERRLQLFKQDRIAEPNEHREGRMCFPLSSEHEHHDL